MLARGGGLYPLKKYYQLAPFVLFIWSELLELNIFLLKIFASFKANQPRTGPTSYYGVICTAVLYTCMAQVHILTPHTNNSTSTIHEQALGSASEACLCLVLQLALIPAISHRGAEQLTRVLND